MGIKISNLPSGAAPTGVEIAPFVQSANTVSLSVADILTDCVITGSATINGIGLNIGGTTPVNLLIQATNNTGNTANQFFIYERSTATIDGDWFGAVNFGGFDGNTIQYTPALINGAADGNWSPGSSPTLVGFWTTPSGSVDAIERMVIDSNGFVNIGGYANVFSGMVEISGDAATVSGLTHFSLGNSEVDLGIHLYKTRGSTPTSHTVVQVDDLVAAITAYGSNGSDYRSGASLAFFVDAEPTTAADLTDMPMRIVFSTAPDGSSTQAERMRIDNQGNVCIGGTAIVSTVGNLTPNLEINALGSNTIQAALHTWSNSQFDAPNIVLARSRGTTIGDYTTVAANDLLGVINFGGSDGAFFRTAATIVGWVDNATVGSDDMPGLLEFRTSPDGSSNAAIRMALDSKGNVVISSGAIATNATDGFLYVPTCAGVPNGTPTTYAGRAPIVIDTTDNRLYFYSTGAWRNAGP